MLYLILSVVFFLPGVVSHILACRLKLMKLDPVPVGMIFLVGFLAYLAAIFYFVPARDAAGQSMPDFFNAPFFLTSSAIYLLLALWYVGECTILQYESPSLRIIRALLAEKSGKVTYEGLRKLFSNEELIVSRLDDLVAHRHIRLESGRYFLNPKSLFLVRVIQLHRKLLKRGLGG